MLEVLYSALLIMMGMGELLLLVLYSATSPEVEEGAGATSTVCSLQWWASYFHKVTELLYFRYY